MAWVYPEIRVKEGSLILEIWARWQEESAPLQRIASLTVPYVLRESGGWSFDDVGLSFWRVDDAGVEGRESFVRRAGPVRIGELLDHLGGAPELK
jgi:hypothetical protein